MYWTEFERLPLDLFNCVGIAVNRTFIKLPVYVRFYLYIYVRLEPKFKGKFENAYLQKKYCAVYCRSKNGEYWLLPANEHK